MCRLVPSTGDLEQQGTRTIVSIVFVVALGSHVPEQHLQAHPVSCNAYLVNGVASTQAATAALSTQAQSRHMKAMWKLSAIEFGVAW